LEKPTHNPKVVGSNPASATKQNPVAMRLLGYFFGSMSIVGVTQNGNTNILFERKFVIQLLHKILCVHMFAKSPQLICLEWLNKEIRRKTSTVEIFLNPDSYLRR
jgi:hypothetical protein